MMSKANILMSLSCKKRGENVGNERKPITLRVPDDLKFQIEKAVVKDGFNTTNAWMIYVITKYLEQRKK